MRLIDADALTNRIVFHTDLDFDTKEAVEDEIQIAPTIGGWILPSERLPKGYQECLFTVECFHWANEPITYKVIQKAYSGSQDFIAWMPLPEPYKEQTERRE